jgi:hypothetical protein
MQTDRKTALLHNILVHDIYQNNGFVIDWDVERLYCLVLMMMHMLPVYNATTADHNTHHLYSAVWRMYRNLDYSSTLWMMCCISIQDKSD